MTSELEIVRETSPKISKHDGEFNDTVEESASLDACENCEAIAVNETNEALVFETPSPKEAYEDDVSDSIEENGDQAESKSSETDLYYEGAYSDIALVESDEETQPAEAAYSERADEHVVNDAVEEDGDQGESESSETKLNVP